MVVSFDFDNTLLEWCVTRDNENNITNLQISPNGANPKVFPIFLNFLDEGCEVHIVTTRSKRSKSVVELILEGWQVLHRIAGIHFTDGHLKRDTLVAIGSSLHHDDDQVELDNLPSGCEGWLAPIHPSWLNL